MNVWRPHVRWLGALALPCLLLACSPDDGNKDDKEDGGLIFPGFDAYKPPQDIFASDQLFDDLDVVSDGTPLDPDGEGLVTDPTDVVGDDGIDAIDPIDVPIAPDIEPDLDIKEDDEEGQVLDIF